MCIRWLAGGSGALTVEDNVSRPMLDGGLRPMLSDGRHRPPSFCCIGIGMLFIGIKLRLRAWDGVLYPAPRKSETKHKRF